jgi:hypothetical protein
VIGADADPSGVVGDIIDALRHGTLQLGIDEVVNVDEFRRALTAPFPTVVPEIAYQFLLFVSRTFCIPDAKRLMVTADGGGSNGYRASVFGKLTFKS